ncbi:MAG: hypothetical protein GY755_02525 [Chloroflexi bacterium]|nr:hypothetical protein [Chloroflexota bacterium]
MTKTNTSYEWLTGEIVRKEMLKWWNNISQLGNSRAAYELRIVRQRQLEKKYTGIPSGRGLALQEVLKDLIEEIKPTGNEPDFAEKHWRLYTIIDEQYLKNRAPNVVIEELGVSKSTYYREQNNACELLAEKILLSEIQLASAASKNEETYAVHLSHAYNLVGRETTRNWLDKIFKWQEADEHARSSWAGMFIWSLNIVTNRFTPESFLKLMTAILLWMSTAWFVSPLLQWPLDSLETRKLITTKYAIASLVIPLCVGLLSKPDPHEFKIETRKHRFIIFFLRMTGAFVGFNGFAAMLIIPVSIGHYLGFPTLPLWITWFLVLIPLLFSQIGARRIPADRYIMFGSSPRLHKADLLFFSVFLFFGIFFAIFFYLMYDYISNPIVGIQCLIAILILSIWKKIKIKKLNQ